MLTPDGVEAGEDHREADGPDQVMGDEVGDHRDQDREPAGQAFSVDLRHVQGDLGQHDADPGHHGGDDLVAKDVDNPGQDPGETDDRHDD